MSDKSQIEWTDATWNVTTGCTKVSPECAHCYIERTTPFRVAGRKFVKGHIPLQFHAHRLEQPLHWTRPRMVFVDSLSDLFHEDVPDAFIDRVFAVMAMATRHTFQVLTKRPERMREYLCDPSTPLRVYREFALLTGFDRVVWRGLPLPNVWLGVSAGNRAMWRKRVPELLKVPAAVHWVSIEPILEDMVDPAGFFTISLVSGYIEPPLDDKIDWVVVGGESGPKARPCVIEHVDNIVRACRNYDTPVFVKQLGDCVVTHNVNRYDFPDDIVFDEWGGAAASARVRLRAKKGGDPAEWPPELRVREYPTPAAPAAAAHDDDDITGG